MEEWESTKQSIIEYYDKAWPNYSKYISQNNLGLHYGYYDKENKNHHNAMLNMNNQVAIELRLKKDDKYTILDAGCGVGGTTIHLAKNFPNITFTGITISDEQIILASDYSEQKGVKNRVTFLNRDFMSTGLPNETFDAVYSLESMCYAYDKQYFLKEMKRILKPGGRIAILDGFRNGEYPTEPSLEKKYNHWCNGWRLEQRLETQLNFKRYLKEEGFQEITYRDITLNVLPSSKRLYRLALKSLIIVNLIRIFSRYDYKNFSRAAEYQKKLLQSRYLVYGAFSAQKSS
ncbi:MAG: SAM-dependent methyltransferase [Promethearchaeota archaeon]|jgi:ubiquinone/menaquinone biosynthesis C-methylase UbiE